MIEKNTRKNPDVLQTEGMIIKGVGGFYYVECGDRVYECRARGALRGGGAGRARITPLAGDRCVISVHPDGLASVDSILERRNFLLRPPLANLDVLFIVVSLRDPPPNALTVDRFISLAEHKGIEPVIVITKLDLAEDSGFGEIYRKAGFTVIDADYTSEGREFLGAIRGVMKDKICAFAGNTGAGKSTLLNALCPGLDRETGETSKKLGRGRHTTRETELFSLDSGGKIADTPGFSSFDGEFAEFVYKDELADTFREFADFSPLCRFTGCSHTCEKGCEVLAAVSRGEISRSRHDSYVTLYNEVKDIKEWEKKRAAKLR
ncbi:MAG: ribosome small subunit-dependent GTPase A [Clostridia bacterium]|nr:ribosome small subunit-dependent GTPase A [Clostridia bacterium]